MANAVEMHAVAQSYVNQTHPPVAPEQPAAHVVGNSFVNQYYTVLHSSPYYLHRFYTDESTLTLAEAGNDFTETVQAQRAIHDKVMSLGYDECKAQIHSVDSQYSLKGGVIVQVTGTLSNHASLESKPRNFVQSFFLAVQEKGYFVLNDVFRYTTPAERPSKPVAEAAPVTAPIQEPVQQAPPSQVVAAEPTQTPAPAAVAAAAPANASSSQAVAPVAAPAPTQVAPVAAEPVAPADTEVQLEVVEEADVDISASSEVIHVAETENSDAAPVAKVVDASDPSAPPTQLGDLSENEPEAPAAPMTFAEALRHKKKQAEASESAAARAEQAAAAAQPEKPAAIVKEAAREPPTTEEEGQSTSVFIKNLPPDCDEAMVEKEFTKFGPLRAGSKSVQVKVHKAGGSIAFVEYASAESAEKAKQAEIKMGDKVVQVEEKKVQQSKQPRSAGGRGRGGGGNDGGGRGKNDRGRGRTFGRGGRTGGNVEHVEVRNGMTRTGGAEGGARRPVGAGRGMRDTNARRPQGE